MREIEIEFGDQSNNNKRKTKDTKNPITFMLNELNNLNTTIGT